MGQDEYGAFLLKGKLPNVRGESPQQLLENTEIQNIVNILGLQFGKSYENVKELRYGHLMIMADQVCTNNYYYALTVSSICHFVMLIEQYMCLVGSWWFTLQRAIDQLPSLVLAIVTKSPKRYVRVYNTNSSYRGL